MYQIKISSMLKDLLMALILNSQADFMSHAKMFPTLPLAQRNVIMIFYNFFKTVKIEYSIEQDFVYQKSVLEQIL